jgi:hypothetical protein
MKKNKLVNKFVVALSLSVFIIGCSDDENGATTDFAGIATSTTEAGGTVTIPFRNGSVSQEDLIIDGSATAGEDYTITNVSDEGIVIAITEDVKVNEGTERIRIRIPGSGGNAMHTVNISDNDPGTLDIDLTWADGEAAVDMDLLLWIYDEEEEEWVDVAQSWGSTFEHLQMNWEDPDGTYGLTYNYYDGNVEPMTFTAEFTPASGITVNGALTPLTFTQDYTLDNEDKSGDYQIEQTFVKDGFEFSDFSAVDIPASGSRQAQLVAKLRAAAAERRAQLNK